MLFNGEVNFTEQLFFSQFLCVNLETESENLVEELQQQTVQPGLGH